MESESKFVKYGFIVEIALPLRRLIVQESADKINPQTVFYLGYSEPVSYTHLTLPTSDLV